MTWIVAPLISTLLAWASCGSMTLVRQPELSPAHDARKAIISEDDLRERLRLHSAALVAELYDLTQKQVQFETARQARIESKATSLLQTAGLSLTVASSAGGFLVKEAKMLADWMIPLVCVFASALACGLAAAILATCALRVNEKLTLNENALFDRELLRDSDGVEAEEDAAEKRGLALFRRSIVPHLWTVAQAGLLANEVKARRVKRGQDCFLAFLGLLLVMCAGLVTVMVRARTG